MSRARSGDLCQGRFDLDQSSSNVFDRPVPRSRSRQKISRRLEQLHDHIVQLLDFALVEDQFCQSTIICNVAEPVFHEVGTRQLST